MPGFAATPAASVGKKRPAASKRSATKRSSKPSTTAKTARTSPAKSSKKPAPVYRRSAQQQPTPARYKEIQQALSDKGYFSGTPDGTWGPESVDALKRFQRDQNIGDDGKIGALSLIALGLGPRRVAAAAPPQPVQ